jgi:hypothetical protein
MSEFDRRAQAWVKHRFGVVPDLGSVEFSNDCAAYDSGGWANVGVDWKVNGQHRGEYLSECAWDFDWDPGHPRTCRDPAGLASPVAASMPWLP